MRSDHLMGIDVGTQSTRVALLTLTGETVAAASRAQEMQTPRAGWAEQDPDIWWRHTVECIQEVLAATDVTPDSILGIGVGGQMHGAVPLDADGKVMSHAVQLWCDKRSADLVDAFGEGEGANRAYAQTGNPPVANWTGFKLQWLQRNDPQLYESTWKFVVPKDYINFRLTDVVSIDESEASGFFLMDAHTGKWANDVIEQLELDVEKLPPIRRSSDVIGHVTASAARHTGLVEGTPVVAGGGDMLCMLLAAGLTERGAASDITGTSGILSVFTESPVFDPRLMNLHHVTNGWVPFGITDSGGVSLKWFKDEFCRYEVDEAARLGVDVYDLLSNMAARTQPGAEGLLFFPYLMGERTLGTPNARAVFFGLTPRHGIGAMVRSIMEGVTFELRQTLEIVEAAGHPVEVIYHSGGGAYSDLWSQIKADIYQKPVITFKNTEGGLLGAAILAGVGAGVYDNPGSGAKACLQVDREFTPDPTLVDQYDRQFALFQELHDLLQDPYDKVATLE